MAKIYSIKKIRLAEWLGAVTKIHKALCSQMGINEKLSPVKGKGGNMGR
jgi:hypothetical protein